MSAKANGALRTGRAALVRAFLRRQRTPKSAREILDAVEPDGNISLMTATLSTLHGGGQVLREGQGMGNVRWKIASIKPSSSKPAAQGHALKAAAQKHVREPKVKPLKQPTLAEVSKTIVRATHIRREQKPNFSAPLNTVVPVKRVRPTHETVEEFLQRGGRVQQLSLGESSQPLQHIHDQRREQRAKGRATQKRIRAIQSA